MRARSRGWTGLAPVALIALLALVGIGCSDDNGDDGGGPGPGPREATLSGTIDEDRTLSADTTYTVQGFVRIAPGVTLTIPAGTVLLSDPDSRGTLITRRCDSNSPSAQLRILGTATTPVIFRPKVAEGTARERGLAGGIELAGCAPVNLPTGEGISEGVSEPFGGDNADDSSGEIHYLVIEFGGREIAPDNEINGLTFNGVGAGTVVDHVQSHFIADDGFEWFGGTVNASFLVSSANDDDNFDCDNGWVGGLQFGFVIEDKNLGNRGEECDNDANGSANEPITNPNFWNITYIGGGPGPGNGTGINNGDKNDGLYIRRNSGSQVHNAIIANWTNVGVSIDGDGSFARLADGTLTIDNLLFFNNRFLGSPAAQAATDPIEKNINRVASGVYSTDGIADAFAGSTFVFADPQLTSVDYENPIDGTQPNPLPQSGSPALDPASAATPSGPGVVDGSATYLGAFGSDNWIDGWTTWDTQ
ncbi:MAG TPA: hypothetical protein VGQ25_06790 [Gemmatimonadales bacterium]|jgi:hypothetical protein|nr:hypothetical protein [Gemmatimonadales bacterium]